MNSSNSDKPKLCPTGGRVLPPLTSPESLDSLQHAIQEHCLHHGEFVLASGLTGGYYCDTKQVTLHPRWASVIGRLLVGPLLSAGAQAVGGMATGAIPIAVAVSLAALERGLELPVFYVREARKGHGAQDEVAGAELVRGLPVAIVEDVVTTGGSALRAAAAVEALGCQVVLVAALVERHEGGGQEIRQRGYPFFRLFYTDEDGQLTERREDYGPEGADPARAGLLAMEGGPGEAGAHDTSTR